MSSSSLSRRRVLAGSVAELATKRLLLASLAPEPSGRPREAIVVLDEHEIPRAYLNECRHLPIPLDAGSREFLVGSELQCATHGARYRLSDGLCVAGPCRGSALAALAVELASGLVFVLDPT